MRILLEYLLLHEHGLLGFGHDVLAAGSLSLSLNFLFFLPLLVGEAHGIQLVDCAEALITHVGLEFGLHADLGVQEVSVLRFWIQQLVVA